MIVRVAVVPHPPLLVPEVAAGAAVETAGLREACLLATRALAAVSDRWVAVAAGAPGSGASVGSFAGYGVDVRVGLDPAPGPAHDRLPLPLLVAGWLRGQVAPTVVTVHPELVAPGTAPVECAAAGRALGRRLADTAEPVGLLVLGDGAATHTAKAPGHFHHRAAVFDEEVAAALGDADLATLLRLDGPLATQVQAAGREAWQVGAEAARQAAPAWRGELLHSSTPYGVAYHVAVWNPAA